MSGFMTEFVIATPEDLKADWACVGRSAFRCAFCSHRFAVGDEYRAIFTNDIKGAGGNPLTCKKCWDMQGGFEGLRASWMERCQEWRELLDGKFCYWGARLRRRGV